MRLSPKPERTKPLLGWNELDIALQSNFERQKKNSTPSLTIDLNSFEMSFEEIKAEATANGYTVTRVSENSVKFT